MELVIEMDYKQRWDGMEMNQKVKVRVGLQVGMDMIMKIIVENG